MNLDIINSIFQSLSIIFFILNLIALIKYKDSNSISISANIYFIIVDSWLIYYMYNLNQYYSTILYTIILIINSIYTFLVIKYKNAK